MRRSQLSRLGVAAVTAVALLSAGCGSGHGSSASETTAAAATTTSVVSTTRTSAPSTTIGTSRRVLPPATIPPKVDECNQQLTFGVDGNASPVRCANGDLNVVAWDYFASNNLLVMALGPYATPGQVQEALCADLHHNTIPIETSSYQIAALYYGWTFALDPSAGLPNGECQS